MAALELLTDLLSEFSFVEPVDRAVALSGTADRPGARLAGDGADVSHSRPHAGDRQELSGRRDRHDRHRPAVPGDHRRKNARKKPKSGSAACS